MIKYLLLISFLVLQGCATTKTNEQVNIHKDNLPLQENLTGEAAQAYGNKQWLKSYDLYKNLVQQSPDNSEYWFRLAVATYRQDRHAEAESYFEQVIMREPRHRKALYNLTLISLSKGTRYMEQFLKVTPPDMRDPVFEKTLNDLKNMGW